jgi:hypothetical protein
MNRLGVVPALILLATAALAACGDDGSPTQLDPQIARAVGSYTAEGPFGAIELRTVDGEGEEVDWLAAGASVVLELRSDMSTAGRLFIPYHPVYMEEDEPWDIDEDLTGTWDVADGVVTLDHEADTFLRDMGFVLGDDELSGTDTFGDIFVVLRLDRR